MPEVIEFGYRLPSAQYRLLKLMTEDPRRILVDIRYSASSKYKPEWSYEALCREYNQPGPRYVHIPELGNINFFNDGPIKLHRPERGIPRLIRGLQRGYTPVVMCACENYEVCHRRTVIELLQKQYQDEIQLVRQPLISPNHTAAISISQPWLELILLGLKSDENDDSIENRDWKTKHRKRLLLHAPKTFEAYAFERGGKLSEGWKNYGADVWNALPKHKALYGTGAILGVCDLVDIVTESSNRWFRGTYGFVLKNIRRFEQPIPWPGASRLFEVPNGAIKEQVSF